ncbi:MAG: cadmium-translocating P-type ATPase [Clostridia bacterium]|nr:cadmium-translocating P-type ATPase [Clostridia bacterium]
MSRKNKRALFRIITSLVALAIAVVVFNFVNATWYIKLPVFLLVYFIIGYDVLIKACKNIVGGMVTDESFLMCIATIGAFFVGEYPEAVAVMLFYQVGELFQRIAVGKSRASISALMDLRPDCVTVVRDGVEEVVDVEEVSVGEQIIVAPGERIGLDGTITQGRSALNMTALTGETVPIDVKEGDEVLSGAINEGGVLRITVTQSAQTSTVGRILDLVENATQNKAKTESFITRFALVYTPVVVICALLLAVLPPLFLGVTSPAVWSTWVYRALVFLVVSCPCALVISVPLAFFGAIGKASRQGVLVKGGNYLELLAQTDVVLMDKTGTITKGCFEIIEVYPLDKKEEILNLLAIAESRSTHPIVKALVREGVDESGYEIKEIAGYGVFAQKGEEKVLCGNAELLRKNNVVFDERRGTGTPVYVARNGQYLGYAVVGDTVKSDSREAIKTLKDMGIKVVMLTGDKRENASAVAQSVGVDEYESALLPADKVSESQKYLGRKGKTAFVGDGINDAPVLAGVDVGISMGGIGSDCAIEASDVVLISDSLKSIPVAIKTAKKSVRIAKQNVVFALGIKFAVLALSVFGFANMWLAVFADVGVTLLAVLNSMRMLTKTTYKK